MACYMLTKRLSAILMAFICLSLLFPAEQTTAAGDSISIVSVSPETFQNYNDPVNFSVAITYSLQSADKGIVYLGFNSNQIDVFSLVEDNAVVVKGSGSVTLTGTVTPAGWGTPSSPSGAALGSMEALNGQTFCVYANLSEYIHPDPWEPLAYDIAPLKQGASASMSTGEYDEATFSGNSYRIFNTGMAWDEAEAYCESLGGHLVAITSQEEQDFIDDAFLSNSSDFYWIGGYKDDNETWNWVTGESFTYTAWNPGEPNNQGGIENRININYRNSKGWNDAAQEDQIGFICEWDDAGRYSRSDGFVYVDTLAPTTSDRYTGNEGDSFISKVGTRNGSRSLNGVTFQHGLEVWVARWNFTDEISWVWNEYELDANFASLKGILTVSDDCYNKDNFDTTLVIYGDGQELASFRVTGGFEPIEIDVDVTGVYYVKISAVDNIAKRGGTSFLLGDLKIYWAGSYDENKNEIKTIPVNCGYGENGNTDVYT